MDCNQEKKHKQKNSVSGIILSLIAILLVTAGLLWYYYPHLLWKYYEWKLELQDIEKVPNSPMSAVDIPENWIEHSWGYVRLYFPPEMSVVDRGATGMLWFEDEKFRICITQTAPDPYINAVFEPLLGLEKAPQLHPSRKSNMTWIQLRLESYSYGSSDFSWSKSRKETLWYSFLIQKRPIILYDEGVTKFTESFSRDNCESIIFHTNRPHCELQSTCCNIFVNIYSRSLEEDQMFDINSFRAIVQSIEVNCGCSAENE